MMTVALSFSPQVVALHQSPSLGSGSCPWDPLVQPSVSHRFSKLNYSSRYTSGALRVRKVISRSGCQLCGAQKQVQPMESSSPKEVAAILEERSDGLLRKLLEDSSLLQKPAAVALVLSLFIFNTPDDGLAASGGRVGGRAFSSPPPSSGRSYSGGGGGGSRIYGGPNVYPAPPIYSSPYGFAPPLFGGGYGYGPGNFGVGFGGGSFFLTAIFGLFVFRTVAGFLRNRLGRDDDED